MELVFTCPSCGVQMQIEAEFANQDAECPECGSAISIPPLHIGPNVVLGGFRLDKKLGSGSMGDVYLAEQITMKRKVAVKILPASMTRDPQSVERFLHEVQTLARFEHPNIVTAFDAGEDEGTYFLAMSYVNGEDLDSIVKSDGPMDEARALQITRKVAIALQFAWQEHQLLHRDVKPENVMIDGQGEIRLMDMGISKSAHEDSNLTMPGVVFGTPHYMSPEQAWSEEAIDFRADLYSLGASLYRLVTGEPPYTGTSQSVFAKLAKPDPFPLPRELRPDLSEEADHLIHVMMAPKPEQRYDTWDECIADIQRVIDGKLPKQARPPRDGQPEEAPPPPPESAFGSKNMQVLEPKSRGRGKPKLSLSRTEQLKTPGANAESDNDEQEDAAEESSGDGKPKLALRGRRGGKGKAKGKGKKDQENAAATPVDGPPPVADGDSGKPAKKPRKAKQAAAGGAASSGGKKILKVGGMAAAVVVFLGACWVAYAVLNGVPILPGGGDDPAIVEGDDDGNGDNAAVAGTSGTPTTGTTTTTTRPPPRQPTTPPPPDEEPEPTFAELRAMVEEEVRKGVAEITIDAAEVAREMGYKWPLEPPKSTSAELIEYVERRAQEEANERFPLEELEAKHREEAINRYGVFREGEKISVSLMHGLDKQITDTLHSIGASTIRLGDRNVPIQDLTPDDRERLDPETARRNVNNYINFKMRGVRRQHAEYKAAYRQRAIPIIHQRAGYVLQNNRYVPAVELIEAEVEKRRREAIADVRSRIENRIYKRHGYAERGGAWVKTGGS